MPNKRKPSRKKLGFVVSVCVTLFQFSFLLLPTLSNFFPFILFMFVWLCWLGLLYATTSEMFVERAILADEIKQKNPQILTALLAHLSELEKAQGNNIPVEYISHEEFKKLSHESKAIVRSGECSPYANVILVSGVPF